MVARILITLATLLYGVLPLLADLSDTHVLNPSWTPHARFHLVWLLGTGALIAALALWLLWVRGDGVLAAVLGLCVLAGFWIAVATKSLYGGALADGVTSADERTAVGANAVFFGLILVLLVVGLVLHSRHRATTK